MNRVINDPNLVVEDMLEGWLLAHDDTVCISSENARVVQRVASQVAGKVGLITGGGSGHEPAFLGYVGDGLLDAVAVGEIFSSPTSKSFLDAMRIADTGAGVACLYGNYAGDTMNVKMAIDSAAKEGITVNTVVANDDVPSAPKGQEELRRGVAGEILMWKVGGAKSAQGGSLDEVIAVAQKAINQTCSIGVGLSACIIPAVGKANFSIEEGFMEVGIGHHGEPGVEVRETVNAGEMAELMLDRILSDLPFMQGDRVAVLISGLGATPVMEQYILYKEVHQRLQFKGISVAHKFVGNLFTSLEMMGVTLTLMKLDEELDKCLTYPCHSVGLTVIGNSDVDSIQATTVIPSAASKRPESTGDNLRKEKIEPDVRSVLGSSVFTAKSGRLVRNLIEVIVENRQYLSEIDGLIGDGDHGVNMAKGFKGCESRLDKLGDSADDLATALTQLSMALMDDIGGSMGPLYGSFFSVMAERIADHEQLDGSLFSDALNDAVNQVQSVGGAVLGDKTLMDVLLPARDAFMIEFDHQQDFGRALSAMATASEKGRDSTRDMRARIGRSARLGDRSIGVLDAGAISCCLILSSMAVSIRNQLLEQ